MKFSHTLSLNANPDWADHYIDYAALKKLIHEIESSEIGDSEDENHHPGQEIFLQKLTKQVQEVRKFYDTKHSELDSQLSILQPMLEKSSSRLSLLSLLDEASNGNNELTPLKSVRSVDQLHGIDLQQERSEICDMFVQYDALQKFAELNCTAVQKILKKYDKTMNDNLLGTHLESLQLLLPFWNQNTPGIDHGLQTLQRYFAHFYCNDDEPEALRQLRLMVREVVTYQRHTIWLDVIKDQRLQENAVVAKRSVGTTATEKDMMKHPQIHRPMIIQKLVADVSLQVGIVATILFVLILTLPGIFDDDPPKRNCLAMFAYVSILWAAETLPLFVTSMLVPFLSVILRVVVVDGVRLEAPDASKYMFDSMFSHVIVLLLGGFSIAAALSKHNIAQVLANSISRNCGPEIRKVLLVNMFIALIASMWISNVAAPVLCYSLIEPILKAATAGTRRAVFGKDQLVQAEHDHRLCRALVMGIALASNVGGMASPISSPQNLFALEYAPIGWIAWFIVSVPLCTCLIFVIWGWLIFCFKLPKANSVAAMHTLQKSNNSNQQAFTPTQQYVICVSVGTVLLWCAAVNLAPLTGQMGVLGIVPFVLFFGTGTLRKEDLNNFLWTVVILAMGGLVLGEAVKSSGLLDVMAEAIATFIERNDLSLWGTLCIFTSLVLVCTTFVSHTVGAIVVIPIVAAVGDQMSGDGDHNHSKELVFASALACSAAMGLPVSGFPNMTAVGVEDHLGNRFIVTKDFLLYAVPASILSLFLIVTVGYQLIILAVEFEDA